MKTGDGSMDDALFNALRGGDTAAARAALQAGANPNAIMADWPFYRALHVAVDALGHGGELEAIELLLKYGAEPDGLDGDNDATPLLMAIFRGHPEAVRLLLEAGADANTRSSEGNRPLCRAAMKGDLTLAKLLLAHGAARTIDKIGNLQGETALGEASRALDPEMVRLLLDAGAGPEAPNDLGDTARSRVVPPADPTDAGARRRFEEVRALLGDGPRGRAPRR
jgi:ankyrin repeat protein